MSTIEDLQKKNEYQEYSYVNRELLLEKYRIPIQNFDFDYVAKCTDANELEKIIDVLRSGQEGYFPELLRATEERLKLFRPNSRFLRQRTKVLDKFDLEKNELEQITNDLNKWASNMSKYNRELKEKKINKISCDVKVRHCEPEPQPLNLVKKKNETRINSTDYMAWDKFDPDTEIMKMDLEEEKMRRQAKKAKEAEEKLKRDAENFVYSSTIANSTFVMGSLNKDRLKKSVSFNKYSTEAEASFISDRELEKGREFFKNGDYELAIQSFSKSVASKAGTTNLNNRALTYIKLKRFQEALNDSEKVLVIDGKNVKGHLRKAQSLEGLRQYEEALACAEFVIEKDPNNTAAQELAERVRKHCRNILKNTRMKIIEIE